jgi:hypothetical protein
MLALGCSTVDSPSGSPTADTGSAAQDKATDVPERQVVGAQDLEDRCPAM